VLSANEYYHDPDKVLRLSRHMVRLSKRMERVSRDTFEREKSYKSAVTKCDECTARRMRGACASLHPNRDCLS
jgi:hypothetical protein